MRILIVKLGAIGDIVHALPALAAIRARFPDDEISWAVERRSAEILRGNRLIDNLIELDTRSLRVGRIVGDRLPEARRQWRALRKRQFDVALDFQGLLKSATIAKLSACAAPLRIFAPKLARTGEPFSADGKLSIFRRKRTSCAKI
jgi:ADP-heptose:LPS heptosyltransferase